jgi:hypothetical protein
MLKRILPDFAKEMEIDVKASYSTITLSNEMPKGGRQLEYDVSLLVFLLTTTDLYSKFISSF